MSEIEDLRKRVTELEKAAEPPKPFVPTPMPRRDLTEGMSMDRETMLAHARAVGGVMPEDRLAFQLQQRSQSPPAEPQRPRGSGWVEPRPLESPPGVALADKLVDAQDRIDKTELAMRLAKTEAALRVAKKQNDEDAA